MRVRGVQSVSRTLHLLPNPILSNKRHHVLVSLPAISALDLVVFVRDDVDARSLWSVMARAATIGSRVSRA